MFSNRDLDREIAKKLEPLNEVPGRDANRAAEARTKYLTRARLINNSLSQQSVRTMVRKKERTTVMMKFATIALALVILVAGAGAGTVYAAQESLPNQLLYGIKTFSEDLRLEMAGDTANQFQLTMQFINRRGDEIVSLKESGALLGEPVLTRLQQQLFYSLQFAAGLDDIEMQASLNQFRNTVSQQEQKMAQVQQGDTIDTQLQYVQALFQIHNAIAEGGIKDPATFREQARSGNLTGMPDMPGPVGPPDVPAKGDHPIPSPEPQGDPKGNGDPSGPQQQGPAGPSDSNKKGPDNPPSQTDGQGNNSNGMGGGVQLGSFSIMVTPVVTTTVTVSDTSSNSTSGNGKGQQQGPSYSFGK